MAGQKLLLLVLATLAVQTLCLFGIDDDQCPAEMIKILDKYDESDFCYDVLNSTINATSAGTCPSSSMTRDCFARHQDDWTDLTDDCENVFKDSACLSKYTDDGFERWIKDLCAIQTNLGFALYSTNSTCYRVIADWIYATNASDCPEPTFAQGCFMDNQLIWTQIVDNCEGLLKTPCAGKMTDDQFEVWMESGKCGSAANKVLSKYPVGDECLTTLMMAMDSVSGACPSKDKVQSCFMRYEDDWTDLVDECETLFSDSRCMKTYYIGGDDSFEMWLKDDCAVKMNAILDLYGSNSTCKQILRDGIYATGTSQCPSGQATLNCFKTYERQWVELIDDCERVFSNSACLNKFSDDGFENWLESGGSSAGSLSLGATP